MTALKEGKRKIVPAHVQIDSMIALPLLPAEKDAWLATEASRLQFTTALAHSDDGVNWGVFGNGAWRWSHEAYPRVSPAFRWETLQQLRCFGARAEVFVWRVADGFGCRIIEDVQDSACAEEGIADCFDEHVLLWGKGQIQIPQAGIFALMQEGRRGLRHAPPTAIAQRGHVTFRHYLKDDEAGRARVVASRLVDKE